MTWSKYSRKAHSSRMVWRERGAGADEHATVDVNSSKKSPFASRPISSLKVAENDSQGNKRSFKSILLSGRDGTTTGQRGQVPCWKNGKSEEHPSDIDLTGGDSATDRGHRSQSPPDADASRTRWSDLSDAMSDCSESAGAWESSTTDAGACGTSSTDADASGGTDADEISVTESTQTTGVDSNSNKEGGSEGLLLIPCPSLEGSEEYSQERADSEYFPGQYFEPEHYGIRTPELLEDQELLHGDNVELEMGEGAQLIPDPTSCYWMPTWSATYMPAGDVAPEDSTPDVLCLRDGSEQSGDGSNAVQCDLSPSTTWAVTGWMPVVTMVPAGEACPQQSDQSAYPQEHEARQMSDCFLPLDGLAPVSEDAISESLIQWKIDSAWSQEGHEASSSEAPWEAAFGDFDPAAFGEFDITFGEFGAGDWSTGDVDAWSQEISDLNPYSSCGRHYVQAAKALANARSMRSGITMFDDRYSVTGDMSLDDGTAASASGLDASSVPDSQDGSLRGNRYPVHGNVPRTRNFAAECERSQEKEEVTTLMIRNIPNRYKRSTLMRELDKLGLTGKYDFLYIPVDRGTSWNVGYAFVNFITPEDASECMNKLANHTFTMCKTGVNKVAQVSPAHMQGFERNVKYYRNCAVYSARECQRPLIVEEKDGLQDTLTQTVKQFL